MIQSPIVYAPLYRNDILMVMRTHTLIYIQNVNIVTLPASHTHPTTGQMNARTHLIGKELAMLKAVSDHRAQRDIMHNFRLARIGPGWVVGDMEGSAS